MTRDPAREPKVVAERQLGDETVLLLDDDRAVSYRHAAISRRTVLKAAATGTAVAGVAFVALPMAQAAASGITGTPSITISPISGPEGTEITVAGTNFYRGTGRTIQTVTIGGVTVTPSSAIIASDGSTDFTFTVPPGVTLGASNTVSVTDNHNNTATKPFTVSATGIAVSPPKLPRNSSPQDVIIGGSGFTPGSTITITNFTGGDFTGVSGGPFTATAAGEIPAGSTVHITYGTGSGNDKLQASDGTHTFQTASITH